jgi:uncharacterized membrane protein
MKIMIKNQKVIFLLLISISLFLQTNYFKSLYWYNTTVGIIAAILILSLTLIFVFITKKQNNSTYVIMGMALLFVIAQYFIK